MGVEPWEVSFDDPVVLESLDALDFLFRIRERWGVDLEGEIGTGATVREVARVIERKLGE
jgi:hypothetical protein